MFWVFGLSAIYFSYYPKSIISIKQFPKFMQVLFTVQITLWFIILFYVALPISILFYVLIVWSLHRQPK